MRLKAKLIVAKRKHRLKTIKGTYTQKQWRELCEFFNGVCPKCNLKKELTADHIIPVTWQSSTQWITNIQPLCLRCNVLKSNTSKKDYRPEHVKQWAEDQKTLSL